MTITKERLVEIAREVRGYTDDGVHWEFDHFDPYKFAQLIRNEVLEEVSDKLDREKVVVLNPLEYYSAWDIANAHKQTLKSCCRMVRAMKEQL